VGIVLGLIFVEPSSLPDIPGHFAVFLGDYDISLSLPQIDLSNVQTEWKRLISTIPEPWKLNTDGREFQVGDAMKARGLEAKYPVVLIPGVISTVCSLFWPRTLVSQLLPESRILVNLTGIPPVLPSKSMGRIIHALASDFQPREVVVDACFGPGDRSGSQRSEGPGFRGVRRCQQFCPRVLDLVSFNSIHTGSPGTLKGTSGQKSSRTSL